MKLTWLTDLHLVAPGSEFPHRVDPAARTRQCLDHIRAYHADADRLIITGDLIQLRQHGAYALLKDLLVGMPMPVKLLVGNHDNRDAFFETFPDAPQVHGFVQDSEIVGGHQLIYLDTLADGGKHFGQLSSARLEWLDQVMSQYDGPALLFMHHPPAIISIPPLDNLRLNDGDEELYKILRRHKQRPIHLFCGHVHRSLSGVWRGFPYAVMTTPHVGIAFDMHHQKLQPVDEAPGYGVILGVDDNIVVHTQVRPAMESVGGQRSVDIQLREQAKH